MGSSLHGTPFDRRSLTASATRWPANGSGSMGCLRARARPCRRAVGAGPAGRAEGCGRRACPASSPGPAEPRPSARALRPGARPRGGAARARALRDGPDREGHRSGKMNSLIVVGSTALTLAMPRPSFRPGRPPPPRRARLWRAAAAVLGLALLALALSAPAAAYSRLEPSGGDLPADTTTTGEIAVGGDLGRATRQTRQDVDWFRVSLAAGQTYTIDLLGSTATGCTLIDPVLQWRARSGRAADRRHLAERWRNGPQQPADLHPGPERGALRRCRRRLRERLYRNRHLCRGGHRGQRSGRRGAAAHRLRRQRACRADRPVRPCRHRGRAPGVDRVRRQQRHRLRGAAGPHRVRHDADHHRLGPHHEPVRRSRRAVGNDPCLRDQGRQRQRRERALGDRHRHDPGGATRAGVGAADGARQHLAGGHRRHRHRHAGTAQVHGPACRSAPSTGGRSTW